MKRFFIIILLLALFACKKKANTGAFLFGFLGILSQEPPVEVTIGGTVVGLKGKGLVLQNNGGDDLPITGDGTFQFPKVILEGTSYNVTVKTQPTEPSQTCVVAGGIGQVLKEPITTVTVNCTTNKYTLGGTVSGLASTGLQLQNGNQTISIASNGTFAFPELLESGQPYNVVMNPANGIIGGTNQPLQNCTLTNGGGVVGDSAVNNIQVVCVTQNVELTINANGITNGTLKLKYNHSQSINLTHTTPSHTLSVPSGSSFTITIEGQPKLPDSPQPEVCTIGSNSGVIFANHTVNINCTDATTIIANVSGLSGSGLILQNNNADNLTVGANGNHYFANPMTGGTYNVTVASQPTNPWQTCTVTSGTGTATGASQTANVNCTTNTYKVGGSLIGLAPSNSITIQLDGIDDGVGTRTGASANGNFLFNTAKTSGTNATIQIAAGATLNNPNQICRMTYNGTTVQMSYANTSSPVSLTIPIQGSDISDIVINCSTLYTVSGTITGLDTNSQGLTLALNGAVFTTVSGGDTSFTFPAPNGLLATGETYNVTVHSQPTPGTGGKWQECNVSLGSGTIASSDVNNVTVVCTTATYTIGGTIVGLTGNGLVIRHVSTDNIPTIDETMAITADSTSFTFPTPQQSGTNYTITIDQPAVGQVCRVLNPTGTVLGGAKSTIYDNNGNPIYSGTMPNPNITSIIINCEEGYMISGTVSNYTGNGLRLRKLYMTGGSPPAVTDESIWINNNGTFAFPNLGTTGQQYQIQIQNEPWGPSQDCSIKDTDETTNGLNQVNTTIATSDVTDITVNCVTETYPFLVVNIVNYLAPIATGLAIKNNASGVTATVNLGDTTKNLDANIESGTTYEIVVSTQPANHTCLVFNGEGRIWGSGVTNVYVNCEPKYDEIVTYEWSRRGYYRLGNASSPFTDSIGVAANASESTSGAIKYASLGLISGDSNGSAFFTGTGYAEVATTTKYDFDNHFSLEAWIVPYSSNGVILSKGNSYSLALQSGKIHFCAAGECFLSTATLSIGKPHHVVVTRYKGNNGARIFLNGIQDSTHNTSADVTVSTANLRIGADSSGGNNFLGVIDDVSLYRYNMNNQTVRLHYRYGVRLTAEYNFAGVLTDSSTYDNTLSPYNAPSTTTDENGLANGAYSFNGINQGMSISSGISTPITQNFLNKKLTFSAWVKPSNLGANQVIFQSGNLTTGYGIRLNNLGRLEAFSGSDIASGNSALSTGKWFHIAAVRTASDTWELYVNGKTETVTNATASVTPPGTGSTFTVAGNSNWTGGMYYGAISRIKLYHAALTPEQVRNLAIQIPEGLVAYYPLNTGSAEDTGYIRNNGTYSNFGSDRFSITNSSATFNGTSQNFTVSNPIAFVNGSSEPRTLCAWVNWNSLPATNQTQTIFQYTNTVGLSVQENSGNQILHVEGFSANLPSISPSQWYHICAVSNGTSYTLYHNGSPLTNTTTGYTAIGSITSLKVGSNLSNANYFDGSIDDIRIYRRALTATEISTLAGN